MVKPSFIKELETPVTLTSKAMLCGEENSDTPVTLTNKAMFCGEEENSETPLTLTSKAMSCGEEENSETPLTLTSKAMLCGEEENSETPMTLTQKAIFCEDENTIIPMMVTKGHFLRNTKLKNSHDDDGRESHTLPHKLPSHSQSLWSQGGLRTAPQTAQSFPVSVSCRMQSV